MEEALGSHACHDEEEECCSGFVLASSFRCLAKAVCPQECAVLGTVPVSVYAQTLVTASNRHARCL